jgi:hypothetical protein
VATVVPFVAGRSLFEIEVSDVPFDILYEMISGYAQYLSDKYVQKTPGSVWTDFQSKQFMYGTLPGGQNNTILLTDIDPIVFIQPTRLALDDANDRVEKMVSSFSEDLSSDHASKLRGILSHLPPKSPDYDPYTRHPYIDRAFE